jgi:hypothetical protein
LYVIGNDIGSVIADDETKIDAIIFSNKRISYTQDFNQNELSGNIKGYMDFSNGLSFSPDGTT